MPVSKHRLAILTSHILTQQWLPSYAKLRLSFYNASVLSTSTFRCYLAVINLKKEQSLATFPLFTHLLFTCGVESATEG